MERTVPSVVFSTGGDVGGAVHSLLGLGDTDLSPPSGPLTPPLRFLLRVFLRE